MESIIITLIICGTFAYLGYLAHDEWKSIQKKPKHHKMFVSIDEAMKQNMKKHASAADVANYDLENEKG